MITFDAINSLVLVGGAVLSVLNVKQVIVDRSVKGLHLLPTLYFIVWGYWNIAFFYNMHSTLSMIGAIILSTVNTVWLGYMLYYKLR